MVDELPVTRTTRTHPDAADLMGQIRTGITALYGVCETPMSPDQASLDTGTLVTLHVDGRRIASILADGHPHDPPAETAITTLNTWNHVLRGLYHGHVAEMEIENAEREHRIARYHVYPDEIPPIDVSDLTRSMHSEYAAAVAAADGLDPRELAGVGLDYFRPVHGCPPDARSVLAHVRLRWTRHTDIEDAVREACAVKIPKTAIHTATGLARTTIDRILNR